MSAVCPKIRWAAFRAAIDKLRGVRGTFYRIRRSGGLRSGRLFGEDILSMNMIWACASRKSRRGLRRIFERPVSSP